MSAVTEWGPGNLPPWFQRVTSVGDAQCALFPEELATTLATLRVSEDDLGRWAKRGWVSFGPDRQSPLEPHEVNEIRFVRDVMRSGLPDAMIAELLGQLPRPFNFDPDEVAYSFSLGWVLAGPLPEDPSDVVEQHIDDWLDNVAANEDEPRLSELRDKIDDLLTILRARR